MFKNFSKIILIFFLYSALPIYAMEKNESNHQSLYNSEANAELLHIINTTSEQLPTQKDWKKIIEWLGNGADPNLKGNDDITILQLASGKRTKEYFNYFLEHGADPNICDATGFGPLHILLAQLKEDPQNFDSEMLETLLQYNANPNVPFIFKTPDTQEDYSLTPLNFAAKFGNNDSIKILIKYKADITTKSILYFNNTNRLYHYSVTPLARAIAFGKLEIIETLCRKDASLVHVSDYIGTTAFDFAFKLKDPEPAIKALIVNARFKLPTTEKKLDLTALTLLLVLKNHKFNFQIPEDLKFRILAMLPAAQNWTEPDSILYEKLFHKNYKNPSLFARLMYHTENIQQILHEKVRFGSSAFPPLKKQEKIKEIKSQLKNDISILVQSKQEILPNNLALQICNNYEELLKEEQAQSTK